MAKKRKEINEIKEKMNKLEELNKVSLAGIIRGFFEKNKPPTNNIVNIVNIVNINSKTGRF